jgi:RNA polymerase sigma-70 factor, ECF subfamily
VPKTNLMVAPVLRNDRDFSNLLAGAQAGDDAAMKNLFCDLHPRLVRFLRTIEPHMADDLASEVWMAVARGIRGFEGDAVSFRAWVFSIARRRAADQRRRDVRRKVDLLDAADFDELPGDADPESVALGRLTGRDAAELLAATLPPDHAEVLLLRVLGDLDVDEVATVMGRTPNWVRVTQHRALQRLADRVGSRIDVIR